MCMKMVKLQRLHACRNLRVAMPQWTSTRLVAGEYGYGHGLHTTGEMSLSYLWTRHLRANIMGIHFPLSTNMHAVHSDFHIWRTWRAHITMLTHGCVAFPCMTISLVAWIAGTKLQTLMGISTGHHRGMACALRNNITTKG